MHKFFIFRKGVSRYAIPIIIFFHLSIVVILSIYLNIWIDEAFSLNTTNNDLVTTLKRATLFELQPPLYFLILNLWRHISQSIFFARLLSILFTCGTIYVTAKLSERLFKQLHPAWVASLVAFNPFVIWAATEIRCYSLVLLLSSLLLFFFLEGYLFQESHNNKRFIYIGLSIIALYTQYYLGFQLVAHTVALVCLRRWSVLLSYMKGMCIVGLGFSPMLFVLPYQMQQHLLVEESTSLIRGLRVVHWYVRKHLLGSGSTQFTPLNRFFFHATTVAAVILLIKRSKKYFKSSMGTVFVIFCVLVTCFLVLVKFISEKSIWYHHSAVLFVPSILFAFSILLLYKKNGQWCFGLYQWPFFMETPL